MNSDERVVLSSAVFHLSFYSTTRVLKNFTFSFAILLYLPLRSDKNVLIIAAVRSWLDNQQLSHHQRACRGLKSFEGKYKEIQRSIARLKQYYENYPNRNRAVGLNETAKITQVVGHKIKNAKRGPK